ncbi:unnamed protein product (mitochondrion) [Plasmodiophora brassicae]|uniref:Polymerase nucleotidyl transferase domain-containing protein n=1 Tax=Plasmodiophora brassicae TaxID=37360 RepID=A0A0G4IXQ2_PLABS|nr:hypothetical protein PBRA_007575 [Plasmodiophora brassicae]SPR02071.1 unnamed protein product [Plasmodiophora brassicae]
MSSTPSTSRPALALVLACLSLWAATGKPFPCPEGSRLYKTPTFEELTQVVNEVGPELRRNHIQFKVIGGYNLFRLRARSTEDIDIAIKMPDAPVNLVELIVTLNTTGICQLSTAAFAYVLGQDKLIKVDFIDSRFFMSLRNIPDAVWSSEGFTMPLAWQLYLKLRTWRSRSQRIAPVPFGKFGKNKEKFKFDEADVRTLLAHQLRTNQTVDQDIITLSMDAARDFVLRFPEEMPQFFTLGWYFQ